MDELVNLGVSDNAALLFVAGDGMLTANQGLGAIPDTAEACIQAARRLGEQGRTDELEAFLATTVAHYPESDNAATHYAWVAAHRQDWGTALTRWEAMLERFPAHWTAMTGKGEALRELRRFDDADAVLEDAMLRYPDNFMPFAHYAWVSVHRGDWGSALERWRVFQTRFPDVEYGGVGIAEALMQLGNLEEAQAAVARATRQFPGSAAVRGLREAIARKFATPANAVERVRQKIRESNIEADLPTHIASPEVLIEITSICNFACTYCVSPMKLREKKHMSMETFKDVMDQVATITTKPVGLHVDGEPTSHPHFREMSLQVNAHGLPVALATNGSHLDPSFLDIWMDMLISMSTTPEELAKRHNKLNFQAYISRIADYADAWARSSARQNVFFQIVHYRQNSEQSSAEYARGKNDFLVEFCRQAGLYETCVEETSVTDDGYRLRRKGHPGILTFIKQGLSVGGLYPDETKFVPRERATAGFCDSPWRLLVVHSNGSLGACCSDLSGGTTFASAEEVRKKSIKELWESSPQIQHLRRSFLEGIVELDVCQRCLIHEQVAMRDNHAPG